tara:strand:- start:3815 stop:5131 length:1317 start_codon:yes stop_codon:yes gene_type:complete
MTTKWLFTPKTFSGPLSFIEHSLPLTLQIGIDQTGTVVFTIDPIPLTNESNFILLKSHGNSDRLNNFSLVCKSGDGSEFSTEALHFSSVGIDSGNTGSCIILSAACWTGKLKVKLEKSAPNPVLRMRLKGFESFSTMHGTCKVGHVAGGGVNSPKDFNEITGYLAVQAAESPSNISDWSTEAEKLLEHMRRILSLAAASFLRAPILEFFHGDWSETTIFSETQQVQSAIRLIHVLDQDAIFDVAIRSFYDSKIEIKQLFFAIEWFSMEATYNEIRLINIMTAIENLLDANLKDDENQLLSATQFKKLRREVASAVQRSFDTLELEGGAELYTEISEKYPELNRRSLLRKLEILASKWNVPLEDIGIEKIKAAKRARDRIVHKGQYYEEAKSADSDLWTHFTVAREVAVRFLFTAIGYEGGYISHMGGYHQANFPPKQH